MARLNEYLLSLTFYVTWYDRDSLQSSQHPKGSKGCQISKIYAHSQVSKTKKEFQIKLEIPQP